MQLSTIIDILNFFHDVCILRNSVPVPSYSNQKHTEGKNNSNNIITNPPTPPLGNAY